MVGPYIMDSLLKMVEWYLKSVPLTKRQQKVSDAHNLAIAQPLQELKNHIEWIIHPNYQYKKKY